MKDLTRFDGERAKVRIVWGYKIFEKIKLPMNISGDLLRNSGGGILHYIYGLSW